jgi:hypothetical protein
MRASNGGIALLFQATRLVGRVAGSFSIVKRPRTKSWLLLRVWRSRRLARHAAE